MLARTRRVVLLCYVDVHPAQGQDTARARRKPTLIPNPEVRCPCCAVALSHRRTIGRAHRCPDELLRAGGRPHVQPCVRHSVRIAKDETAVEGRPDRGVGQRTEAVCRPFDSAGLERGSGSDPEQQTKQPCARAHVHTGASVDPRLCARVTVGICRPALAHVCTVATVHNRRGILDADHSSDCAKGGCR
jgi:hypothetical protein